MINGSHRLHVLLSLLFNLILLHGYIHTPTDLLKDLMRSKNTLGYFSFYIDNISIKNIFHSQFKKNSHLNPN